MKRLVLLAGLMLALGTAVPLATAEIAGPACISAGGADIVNASVNYGGPGNENAVTGGPRTATASCRDISFTMTVVGYDAAGSSIGILGVAKSKGSGTQFVGQLTVSGITASFVCVYFASSKASTEYDVAPDEKCPASFDPTAKPPTVFASGEGIPGGSSPYQ
jgi:hypothetical protein